MKSKLFSLFVLSGLFLCFYDAFCPEIQLKVDKPQILTTQNPFKLEEGEDGLIFGPFEQLKIVLDGPKAIVVVGQNNLIFQNLMLQPTNPDAIEIRNIHAKLTFHDCTILLCQSNLNLIVENIEIIGNVEFIGLNPGIFKRALNWVLSAFLFEQASINRYLTDGLVRIDYSTHFTGSRRPVFENVICDREYHPFKSIKLSS